MLVHQYIIPRNERAGPLFQYRMHASWYSCGSSLRAEAQWCSSTCYCRHYRYVPLFTNCETFNTRFIDSCEKRSTKQMRTSTVRFAHCEKLFVKQNESFSTSVNAGVFLVCHFGVLFAWVPAWVPEVEQRALGSQTRQSELAFIFKAGLCIHNSLAVCI
jgi:hypothetical protein